MRNLLAVLILTIFVPTGSIAASFVDTFENGENVGGWSFFLLSTVVDEGGNPGPYLSESNCCDIPPQDFLTSGSSMFTGNYQKRQVVELSLDVATFIFEENNPRLEAPLNLRLITDGSTPDDPTDDYSAFFKGTEEHSTPVLFEGWRTIAFSISSESDDLPDGWQLLSVTFGGPVPADATWSNLIRNVSGVSFERTLPSSIYPIVDVLFYEVGADNPSITYVSEPSVFLFLGLCVMALGLRHSTSK